MSLPLEVQLKFEPAHALIDLVREVLGVEIEPKRGHELINVELEANSILANLIYELPVAHAGR
jgi:hypothetical protein